MQRILRTEAASSAANGGGGEKSGAIDVPQNMLKDTVQLYENM